jgi:hypothetical protein
VATAGTARADREVVANHLTAATGENRRTVDQARMLLLAAAGGEPSDAAVIWRHAAEDRGAAVAGGIRLAHRGAIFDDDAGAREKCPRDRAEKGIYGRCLPIRCETGPSRCRWEHVDQYRLKPLQREVVRPYTRVELGESKTEILAKSVLIEFGVRQWRLS